MLYSMEQVRWRSHTQYVRTIAAGPLSCLRGIWLRMWEHGPGEDRGITLMKNLKWSGLLAGAMALGIVSPALSHHSHSMYDHAKEVSVSGTVTKFLFRNPHVFLYVDVKGENGEIVNYWFEMSNLNNMVRRGIGKATF
ncbi:MAG: DUF6152 family protein, partial [Candidatus Binatia bacterium]